MLSIVIHPESVLSISVGSKNHLVKIDFFRQLVDISKCFMYTIPYTIYILGAVAPPAVNQERLKYLGGKSVLFLTLTYGDVAVLHLTTETWGTFEPSHGGGAYMFLAASVLPKSEGCVDDSPVCNYTKSSPKPQKTFL